MLSTAQIRVSVDVGCYEHSVAIGLSSGEVLDEFGISHNPEGFKEFFARIRAQEKRHGGAVAVAMEGYNGHARPLDTLVRLRDYKLYNVNNLKLARFKEIFPSAAKTDRLDARRGLELFQLTDHLPAARGVLQEVAATPAENDILKRLTRRRRILVGEKARVLNRLQSDLRAVCPSLLEITKDADNLWFLNLLASVDDLSKLARLRESTLLKIPAIGRRFAGEIKQWQKRAVFSHELEWVGPMIIEDARRILALRRTIKELASRCDDIAANSELATLVRTLPGFGQVCSAELAGEIGTVDRFEKEGSLAVYIGMANLDRSSGIHRGSKSPRHVNTRAKSAMMTAVDKHRKYVPESQRYYEKKRAEGKTHNQAIRALGRHLSRILFKMLKNGRPYESRT